MNSGAVALLVLVGAGGLVLLAQKTSLLPGNQADTVKLRRGGMYKFWISDEAATVNQMHAWGWASITLGQERDNVFEVSAIWTGEDGYEWQSPSGMGNPVFVGMVTERQTTPDVPMQGPSQTTNQSDFFINFPAQGLVNLNE